MNRLFTVFASVFMILSYGTKGQQDDPFAAVLSVQNAYDYQDVSDVKIRLEVKNLDGSYYDMGYYETNKKGQLELPLVEQNSYKITAQKDGFITQITTLSTKNKPVDDINLYTLSLRPKNCYRIEGLLTILDENISIADAVIQVEDQVNGEKYEVPVEANGKYYACGSCGHTYILRAVAGDLMSKDYHVEIDMGNCGTRTTASIPFIQDIQFDMPVEELPVAMPTSIEDGKYMMGDSFVLKDIIFDAKTSKFEDVAVGGLEELYQTLVDYPELVIELRIHTDTQKSHRYNWLLAQERADVITKFMEEKNVDQERYVVVPMGEEQPLNPCRNCSKSDHDLNDRVEMIVLKGDKDK